jgi:hypothetical protein
MSENMSTGEQDVRSRREIEISEPSTTRFDLEADTVELKTFRLSNLSNPTETTPGLMETGKAAVVLKAYADRRDLIHRLFGGGMVEIPYSALYSDSVGVFGDFSSREGQQEFADADVEIEDGSNSVPDWAGDLHRFAKLKLFRRFSLDEELTALRGLERRGNKMRFRVGMSLYSEAFFSMGNEGVSFALSKEELGTLKQKGAGSEHVAELEELLGILVQKYGAGATIREAVIQNTKGLPEYNQRVHHYLLGVAGTVLTRDGDVVFVNRGAGVSINRGINVTASGAVKYKKDYLARYGLQRHLGRQMHEEAQEEIGLRSGELLLGAMQERIKLELGVEETDYELVPVGMARELPRGGSPEAMFLIRYKGSTTDLLSQIAGNPHEDRSEIDSLVYAYPMENVARLLRQKDAERVVQHKGLLNLMMIDRYLASQKV